MFASPVRFAAAALALLALAAAWAAVSPPPASAAAGWGTNLDKVLKKARKAERPVLVKFAISDVCPVCQKLQREVFESKEFKAWAKESVLLMEADFPEKKKQPKTLRKRNEALLERFEIDDLPTVLLLDPEGKLLGRAPAYEGGGFAKWVERVKPILAGNATPPPVWGTSWAEASARSKAEGKPILAFFTGSDWCTWCHRLEQEVFETEKFAQWTQQFVLLEVDFPEKKKQSKELQAQNEKLGEKYGVEGYPSVLFLDHTGKRLASVGYMKGGADVWVKTVDDGLRGNGILK